jgi:hypothetical protein
VIREQNYTETPQKAPLGSNKFEHKTEDILKFNTKTNLRPPTLNIK